MDELQPGKPLTIANVTLIPIERTRIQSEAGNTGYWLAGFKEAFAIVACDATGAYAFGVDSEEIALDALIEKVPKLQSFLKGIDK